MKNLIVIATLVLSSGIMAQESKKPSKGKQQKETATEQGGQVSKPENTRPETSKKPESSPKPPKKDSEIENNDTESKEGKGNAYGKNKGDKSGKEFGKERSSEAKSKDKKDKKAKK